MLDSEQVHRILAQIADDTGFSMILLRRVFPYDRYFITWASGGLVMLGIAITIVALIICLIDQVAISSLYLYILPLVLLIEAIAFLKYLETCFIRKGKPKLTVALFTEIILLILNKYRNELAFGVQPHERQLWRHKIYEVLRQYLDIFFPAKELSPELMMPFEDPDEHNLYPAVEACGAVMSLSFEEIDQSEIYEKYTSYDEDEPLTVVHFADILIDFWAEKKSKRQERDTSMPELRLNIKDKIGYKE